VKQQLKKINPDLFLSPDGLLCLGWQGKQYGIIHDLNFVHRPQDLKWSNSAYYNYFFPRYAARANRIGTVSAYSKQDMVATFGIAAEKIDVLYSGINDFYHPVSEVEKIATKNAFTNGTDYFVFVSTLHPRKNVIGMLQAFEQFKNKTGSSLKLLLAGKAMHRTGEMHNYHRTMKHANDVVFTGRLDDETLNNVVGSALAMLYVPFFEGFGLPPIEAMQCDVPVIASNNTSLPEVVGNAALLVDPFSVHAIAAAIETIAGNELLRNDLVAKGRIQRTLFSWDKTASLLWNSVSKIL
jgi:glycosyltransferase involved in cell wall biosynthesis